MTFYQELQLNQAGSKNLFKKEYYQKWSGGAPQISGF